MHLWPKIGASTAPEIAVSHLLFRSHLRMLHLHNNYGEIAIMVKLHRKLASHILNNCTARTDDALRARFGISYNTFRKIERGEPIRSSVAARLQDRLSPELSH